MTAAPPNSVEVMNASGLREKTPLMKKRLPTP